LITRLVFALLLAVQLTIAHADNFKVYAPSVESGVTEIQYRAFRDFDRRDEINRSQAHKFGGGRSFNDYWASEVSASDLRGVVHVEYEF
jgi:hypothetical protein